MKSGEADNNATTNPKAEGYLVRKKEADKHAKTNALPSTEDLAARVKEIFHQLVATGMATNAAAAEAIKQTTAEQNNPSMHQLEEGTLNGESEVCAVGC